ncbi:hypothetical protein PC123_g19483 [Phytophthora cactorum]|nr:hypothetical protein PC123_g19483 [Phytophthora cactorum]
MLMTLDTYGYVTPSAMSTWSSVHDETIGGTDDTSVDRARVPPSNIYGASVATSLILAASLIPFESARLSPSSR